MKICYISRAYETELPLNGVSTYIYNIVSTLRNTDNEIHIICQARSVARSYTKNNVYIHAIRPYHLSYYNHNYKKNIFVRIIDSLLGRLIYATSFNILAYIQYQKIQKTKKCDILESEDGGGSGCLPTFDNRTPVLTFLHTPWTLTDKFNNYKRRDSFLIAFFEKQQIKRSYAINANSYSTIKEVSKIFHIRLNAKVIRYGINGVNIRLLAKKNNINISGRYIVYYGSMEPRKGILTLKNAIPIVLSKYTNIKIVFIGQKSDTREMLLKELKKYKEKIIFLPHLHPKKLFPIIKKSCCVVLPSVWEAFGYTCLESMTLGKIVIASSRSGFEEQIKSDGQNGFLFEPENYKQLSEKILHVLNMTRKERNTIQKNAKRMAKKFENKIRIPIIMNRYKIIIKQYEQKKI